MATVREKFVTSSVFYFWLGAEIYFDAWLVIIYALINIDYTY